MTEIVGQLQYFEHGFDNGYKEGHAIGFNDGYLAALECSKLHIANCKSMIDRDADDQRRKSLGDDKKAAFGSRKKWGA